MRHQQPFPQKPFPLPVGTAVHHSINQRWARRATGTIAAVKGPYSDGSFEYLIYHVGSFSGRSGPVTPPSWWSSLVTAVDELPPEVVHHTEVGSDAAARLASWSCTCGASEVISHARPGMGEVVALRIARLKAGRHDNEAAGVLPSPAPVPEG